MYKINVLQNKITFFSLFSILFINGLGFSMIFPLFSDLFLIPTTSILPDASSMQERNVMYGLSLVSFSLGMFFGAPILGELSDRFGRKRILLLSLCGTFFGYVLSGFAVSIRSPELFICGRIIDGLTAGSIPVAQAVITDISTEKNKTGNLGLILFAVTSGYFFGPLFSDIISKTLKQDFSAPFFSIAFLSLINIIFLMCLKETTSQEKNKKIIRISFLNLISLASKIRNTGPLIFVFLFFQLAWSLYFQYLPSFLASAGLNNIISQILSIIGLGMLIAFCFLTRFFQRKLSSIQGSFLALSVLTVAILLQFRYVELTFILQTASFISAIAYGLGYSFLLAQMSQKASKEIQGFIMGIAASMSALTATITAFLGTFLASIFHQLIFLFSFSSLFIAIIIIYITQFLEKNMVRN